MKRIVLIALIMLTSVYTKAQLYSSEACFYIKAGINLTNAEYVAVVLFKGENLYTLFSSTTHANNLMTPKKTGGIHNKGTGLEWGGVIDYLRENVKYYDNPHNCLSYDIWIYDTSLSTSKIKVYKKHIPYHNGGIWGITLEHTIYLAVSQDKSSIIQWYERDGEIIGEKAYYVQIDKEQLLPKAINRDFLYQ